MVESVTTVGFVDVAAVVVVAVVVVVVVAVVGVVEVVVGSGVVVACIKIKHFKSLFSLKFCFVQQNSFYKIINYIIYQLFYIYLIDKVKNTFTPFPLTHIRYFSV